MSDEKKNIIHVDPDVENGNYSNAASILHSANEFILDFISILPGDRRKVVSRIITSPVHAKQFAAALVENLKKYESVHGEIEEPAKVETEYSGPVN